MPRNTDSLPPQIAEILNDAAAFDWSRFSHAYGPATDVPEMLQDLVSPVDDTGILGDDLWGSICHQGTVYSASAPAVQFLARLAAAGVAAKETLWLISAMAESTDTAPGAEDDVRHALRTHAMLLVPLLQHVEVEVRLATAHTLGHARSVDLEPTLRTVFESDEDEQVRAAALLARTRCGAGISPEHIVGLNDQAGPVRLAAVIAALEADLPWSTDLQEALLSVDSLDDVAAAMLEDRWYEPLSRIAEHLCETDQSEAAAHLILDAEEHGVDLSSVLWAANHACEASRIATDLLRPLGDRHRSRPECKMLAETLGLIPGHGVAPLPREPTSSQELGAEATLELPELQRLAAEPLPPYAQLTTPAIRTALARAGAVWERTGDATHVIRTVTEVADRLAERTSIPWVYCRADAARLATRLGPDAAPLEGVLRKFLQHPTALAAAATALVRAGCTIEADTIARQLAGQIGQWRDDDTVSAIAAIGPLMSAQAVREWQEILDHDRRFVRGGFAGTFVAADEQLRDALRAALTSGATNG